MYATTSNYSLEKNVGSEKCHVYRWVMMFNGRRCIACCWGWGSRGDWDECHPARYATYEDEDEMGWVDLISCCPGCGCWWCGRDNQSRLDECWGWWEYRWIHVAHTGLVGHAFWRWGRRCPLRVYEGWSGRGWVNGNVSWGCSGSWAFLESGPRGHSENDSTMDGLSIVWLPGRKIQGPLAVTGDCLRDRSPPHTSMGPGGSSLLRTRRQYRVSHAGPYRGGSLTISNGTRWELPP